MASLISDSDMFIDTLRRREPARTRIGALIRSGDLATTSMSVYELYVGARTDEEAVRIARLLEDVEVFELDAPAARRAAEVYRFLQSAGLRIEQPDCLIAGIALVRNLPLLTRNARDFERVPGLRVITL